MTQPVVLNHVCELGFDFFLPYNILEKHGCKDKGWEREKLGKGIELNFL